MPASRSIKAYDIPERVTSYDADMDLMHPNRRKMLEIILEVLPIPADSTFVALDLGIGTGYFSRAVLNRFPKCRVIAVDGAASMVEVAQSRLGRLAERVDFRIGDFRNLHELLAPGEELQLSYSAFALHHLNAKEKGKAVSTVVRHLKPGGWFLNADLIVSSEPAIENRFQQLRVDGIVGRAAGRDKRFATPSSTRAFIDDLQARDNDKPLTLGEDLALLERAGLKNATAFWVEYREAVTGGFKGLKK